MNFNQGNKIKANGLAKSTNQRFRRYLVLAAFLVVLVAGGSLSGAEAASGDFSGDFVASAPQTYDHTIGGGAFNLRDVGVGDDIVESLEGGDYACNDTVTFLLEISVDDTASADTDGPQTIQADFSFLMDTTGQSGLALGDVTYVGINYGQVENGNDYSGAGGGIGVLGLDGGINDDRQGPTLGPGSTPADLGVGGSTATIISETQTGPIFVAGSELLLTVEVDDLERAETVILRIDVELFCQPGSNPTGNLQADLQAARLVAVNGNVPVDPPQAISGGQQTIPFKQVGDVPYSNMTTEKFCPDFNNDGISGVPVLYPYKVEITNDGPDPATHVYFEDQIPAAVDFAGVTSINPAGTCQETPANSNFLRCDLTDDLAVGATWTVEFTVSVVDPSQKLTVTNTATAYAQNGQNTAGYAGTCGSSTPVTVSFFEATTSSGNGVKIAWSTATETSNAGFNIYAETEAGRQKLNDELIISHVVDSVEIQDYSFELQDFEGGSFYIEDVSLLGESRVQGPFEVDKAFGQRFESEAVDWTAIQIENEALAARRRESARSQVVDAKDMAQKEGFITEVLGWTGSFIDRIGGNAIVTAASATYPVADLHVSEAGIYRVSYEEIFAGTGIDLAGVRATELALTNRGVSVPIFVSSKIKFGPGAYLEFYGEGVDTLYTDTNVYRLQVDQALASRITVDRDRFPRRATTPDYYMETLTIDKNNIYSFASSTGDPWYDRQMFAQSAQNFDYELILDHYAEAAGHSSLEIEMWGGSEWVAGPDHHVLLSFNGQALAEEVLFDRLEAKSVQVALPSGSVRDGVNNLRLTLPMDRGARWDMIYMESYGITYPREFVARDGRLDFEASGEAIRVQGLDSNKVEVYRIVNGVPQRLGRVKVTDSGESYTAMFVGGASSASYVVATEAAVKTPAIAPAAAATVAAVQTDLLIISHPNFIAGLEPLVAARQAQGMKVSVVNVENVYAKYSGGILDPLAIKTYIKDAVATMGVQYVLLVGGDTYDYRGFGNTNSISFIPSLYAETGEVVKFAPVDPLYTDIDGDGVPDRAIGRFPVRTVAELQLMVDKTLLYDTKDSMATPYDRTAIFSAGTGYDGHSQSFADALTDDWSLQTAYIGQVGIDLAKERLSAALNEGVALASFVGHSSTTVWTFDQTSLFSAAEAAALKNNGRPSVISQWGCWNTYYVRPSYDTLAHKFLLSGNNGAAAVTGASTLTQSDSERALGKLMMPELTKPGVSIGDAMQSAKVELAKTNPEMVDVILGWTVLGDPTIMIQQ